MASICEIQFRLPPDSHGWLEINLRVRDKQTSFEISYIADGLAELTIAVIAFFYLRTSQSVLFELEPGNPVFRIDWYGDQFYQAKQVRVRIGEYQPSMVGWEWNWGNEEEPPEFNEICDASEFLMAFSSAVFNLIDEVGLDEFNAQWDAPPKRVLTPHHLALLKAVAQEYAVTE